MGGVMLIGYARVTTLDPERVKPFETGTLAI